MCFLKGATLKADVSEGICALRVGLVFFFLDFRFVLT